MDIPELGVGIIYFSGFKNILESNSELIQMIEIEPQTFWYRNSLELDSFVFNEREIDYLNSIDKPKIFHGVGYPIGGSLAPDEEHIPYLQKMMDTLNPTWFSEHLSFNNIKIENELYNTNFLLPPLQTEEGIELICKTIKKYAANFNLPFAFETGANYLSPYGFELEDGAFVNEIAERSDSYILLDIHNLLANQKNGRQTIKDFINQIDLERVLQIHLAGGFYFNGYYLDAHSNVSSKEVLDVFEDIVKMLPNLKAITFEMLPEYLTFVSENSIRKQLEKMNAVWDKRGTKIKLRKPKPLEANSKNIKTPTVMEWENTLGRLAIGKELINKNELFEILNKDKGVEIIKGLIDKFRSSLVVSSLKLSCRYLMLSHGLNGFEEILKDYWLNSKPLLFASDNGLQFANYLIYESTIGKEDELLKDLVTYEYSSLQTLIDDKQREIQISFNPNEIIPFLSNGKLPDKLSRGNYIITIEPDIGYKKENVKSVFHS